MWLVLLIPELQKKNVRRPLTGLKSGNTKDVELEKRICCSSCIWGTWGRDQKLDDVGYYDRNTYSRKPVCWEQQRS